MTSKRTVRTVSGNNALVTIDGETPIKVQIRRDRKHGNRFRIVVCGAPAKIEQIDASLVPSAANVS